MHRYEESGGKRYYRLSVMIDVFVLTNRFLPHTSNGTVIGKYVCIQIMSKPTIEDAIRL